MQTIKLNKLMLSGEKSDILIFKPYFEEIILMKNNQEILTFPFSEPRIIFFNCDEKQNDCIEMIKNFRQQDRKSIVVITGRERNTSIFFDALTLHLSGYLQKPFKQNDIEKLLVNIVQDMIPIDSEEKIHLKNSYSFNIKKLTLFNEQYNIVKLTKSEKKLMKILSKEKGHYISSENIEFYIWEEASLKQDCNQRLKHLVYCLRKKLPKNSIVNAYDLGYKLVIP